MNLVDIRDDPDLADLTDLLKTVSGIDDPQKIQLEFSRRMRTLNDVQAYIAVSRRGLAEGEYKITRMMLTGEDLQKNAVNPWEQWEQIPVSRGGWIGEVISRDYPSIFRDLHLENDPVIGDALASFRSAAVAPLFDNGEALNWGLIFREEADGFDKEELLNLLMRGNLIGRMTRNLVMRREVEVLNAKLTSQLEEIAQIQMSLLPSRTPSVEGLTIATSYLTSNEAGGDYYDFFDMGDGSFGVFIGDVSGHGAGAATVMAMLQTILHGYQERKRGPAAMLEHANTQLMGKQIEGNFITAYLGVIDPDRRSITFANAGHHPPLLRKESGEVSEILGAGTIPLGIASDIEFLSSTAPLEDGASLVLYTDGITEAFSPLPQREMFGVDRLRESLISCSGAPPCVIDSIHEALYLHTRARERADDQTIVALRLEN